MILVTGSNGQLGNELKLLFNNTEAIFVDKLVCDITNYEQVEALIIKNNISCIINCAAFTAVDLAEKELDKAFQINEIGTRNLAIIAKKYAVKLVHISTDYVFDGNKASPLIETDPVNPITAYGKSKLAGEKAILEIAPSGIIIRTSWLYSSFGNNFIKTILKYSVERKSLSIVYDQIGTPTNAKDLANAITKILPQLKNDLCEVYHYSNEGVSSWYDFAKAICEIKNIKCNILPIESIEYPTPAIRPLYSVLNKRKIKTKFKISIPYWRESLKQFLDNL